ncbi:hypothetical protein G5B10_04105 [Fluviicola sp. SGL-29]|nr:hypothetical protein [Fluviicola sp. SGL-29]
MKPEGHHVLNDWILQQSEFSKNDLLVTINDHKTISYSEIIPLEQITKILSVSQNSIKESGINPFSVATGLLSWEWNNQPVQTPIWITPCFFKIDKVRQQVTLIPDEETGFVNPFLAKKMAEIYSVELDIDALETVIKQLQQAGFETIDPTFKAVGNFHHHRYVLLKELHDLVDSPLLSPSLKQFLSGERTKHHHLSLSDGALLPYDTDHQRVFEQVTTENCVVQGPPGTGKSQLMTNLIGKLVLSGHSLVFISEKRAALEVVDKRLRSCGLGHFSIVATDDLPVRDFLRDLKATWEFLDHYMPTKTVEISTRKEQEDNLQFILDLLNQPQLIGGVSFSTFNALKQEANLQEHPDTIFLPNPPLLDDYAKTLPIVEQLYAEQIAMACSLLPFSRFREGNLARLATTIRQTSERVAQLEQLLPGVTPNDFDQLHYYSVVYQLFQNELAKKYAAIIDPASKARKQFLKLHQEYKRLQKQVEHHSESQSDWKIIPSELELNHLLEVSQHASLLRRLRFKKRWSQVNQLPAKAATTSIQRLLEYQTYKKEQLLVEEKLARLGITDIADLDVLKAGLHLFSTEKWEIYHSFSPEQRQLFNKLHTQINQLKDDLNINYRLQPGIPVAEQLNALLQSLPQFVLLEKDLAEMNQSILDTLSVCHSLEMYKRSVSGTHFTIFQSRYPALSAFEPAMLKEKVLSLIAAMQKEHFLTAEQILNRIKATFDGYNQLITTPPAKLSDEQKKIRQQLKKGKSILVREFSKTRQHPTMRELMHSEAAWWIRLLKPAWLTNPTQLAKTFPLHNELFDVCIMDEASQIPVQNGAGAIHRSKRVIIAGDEQQMNPTAYFRAGSTDVTSVLHHAGFYYPKITLTHHYRSRHPRLIAFSNEHFYDNQLVVYPSFPVNQDCITRHFCSTGKYIDRKNHAEAKKAVELIQQRLTSGKTIGIVAFSQEQADTIRKLIPPELATEIQNRIDQNTCFIKPLEKVQGDECEHLIISLGYAPDEDGNFHLRFGPLNTHSGSNRLNVLLSRASETIDFICSVESSALQWSQNESIQLLQKWLRRLEQQTTEPEIRFPLNLHPVIDKHHLYLADSHAIFPNALELVTTYSVLSNRGWTLHF